jgi:hypothetical protein
LARIERSLLSRRESFRLHRLLDWTTLNLSCNYITRAIDKS